MADHMLVLSAVSAVSAVVSAVCYTIRCCWKSRDHKANVDRICASFESQVSKGETFDLASALLALQGSRPEPEPEEPPRRQRRSRGLGR